jgi:hypothetical protein
MPTLRWIDNCWNLRELSDIDGDLTVFYEYLTVKNKKRQ